MSAPAHRLLAPSLPPMDTTTPTPPQTTALIDTLLDSVSHDTLQDIDMDSTDYSQDCPHVDMDAISQEDMGAGNMAVFPPSESPEI